jgi:hypothetical protein
MNGATVAGTAGGSRVTEDTVAAYGALGGGGEESVEERGRFSPRKDPGPPIPRFPRSLPE